MIQFNLLPDIKLQYIKTQRLKHMVFTLSFIVTSASLAFLFLLFTAVVVVQKRHLTNLSNDINKDMKVLADEQPALNKILTIQNQLNSISGLHDQKPKVTRIYEYLPKLTPDEIVLDKFTIDLTTNTINLGGSSTTIASINKFVDILKFSNYQVFTSDSPDNTVDNTNSKLSFSQVVLGSFAKEKTEASEIYNFSVSFSFNPEIFNSTLKIKMLIPDILSNRSVIEKPNSPFEGPFPNATGGAQ